LLLFATPIMFAGLASAFGIGSPTKAEEEEGARQEASPGSTRAGTSPLDGSSPGATLGTKGYQSHTGAAPGAQGLPEYDYPAPVFIKNTFIETADDPHASLVEFMHPRVAQSCPNSAIQTGAPPGLAVSEVSPDALSKAIASHEAAEKEAKARNGKQAKADDATPAAAVSQPTMWPRTMSGDQLAEMAAAAEATEAASPVCRPGHWPRTMSGDGLDELCAAAAAVTPERGTGSGVKQTEDIGMTPSPSPVRPMQWPRTMSADTLEFTLQTHHGGSPDCSAVMTHPQQAGMVQVPMAPPPPYCAPGFSQDESFPPPPATPALGLLDAEEPAPPNWAAAIAPVLRLSEALPEPELGTPECPTKGSVAHRYNNCKPCAFLHTKGCTNGIECQFCHICEPGEKKKRQREKRQIQRSGLVFTR